MPYYEGRKIQMLQIIPIEQKLQNTFSIFLIVFCL